MKIKEFLNFVEIQTKIASIIPFFTGIAICLYRYEKINMMNLLLMFVSMICFDMATTAINNFCDYKNELKYFKGNYNGNNPMFIHGISQKVGLNAILLLLLIAIVMGITLTFSTNILVLIIGVICFTVGILYTFGPIPISRMPLGEVFSGLFMGLIITFLTIFVNTYDIGDFGIYISENILTLRVDMLEGIIIIIISSPLIIGIANIMLANNICDMDDDIKVGRYTLPYYIGKSLSIALYQYSYYLIYAVIISLVIIKILPITCILVLLTLRKVQSNIVRFKDNQIKSKTFITAVKNFTIIGLVYMFSIYMGFILA